MMVFLDVFLKIGVQEFDDIKIMSLTLTLTLSV